jgi:malate/lactate dehydrogenase
MEDFCIIMKVGVIGGGGIVGSSVVFNAAQKEIVDEVVIIDINEEMAIGHALDIEHAISLENNTEVTVGDYSNISNSEVVIITASAPTPPDLEDRNQLLNDNVPLLEDILSNLIQNSIDCPIVISTNPVDALITIINNEYDFDRRKILGYNLNDTMRLQWAIARHANVDRKSVNAYVLGEHGESQVPVYSQATIAGEGCNSYENPTGESIHRWSDKCSGE